MSIIETTATFDATKGTIKFEMDLQGHTEIEHEILAAALSTARSVTIVPTHEGDELFAEFTIQDKTIWPRAVRALENRKRKADGRPSVEEEEKQIAEKKAAEEEAKAKADAKAKSEAATSK